MAVLRDAELRSKKSVTLDFSEKRMAPEVRNPILFPMVRTRLEITREAETLLRRELSGQAPAAVIEREVAALYEREGLAPPSAEDVLR